MFEVILFLLLEQRLTLAFQHTLYAVKTPRTLMQTNFLATQSPRRKKKLFCFIYTHTHIHTHSVKTEKNTHIFQFVPIINFENFLF